MWARAVIAPCRRGLAVYRSCSAGAERVRPRQWLRARSDSVRGLRLLTGAPATRTVSYAHWRPGPQRAGSTPANLVRRRPRCAALFTGDKDHGHHIAGGRSAARAGARHRMAADPPRATAAGSSNASAPNTTAP
jgi:hypothetical protein